MPCCENKSATSKTKDVALKPTLTFKGWRKATWAMSLENHTPIGNGRRPKSQRG